MGIFDIFTADPAKEAAAQNAQLYQQYGTQSQNLLGQYGTQASDLYKQYLAQAQPLLQQGTAQAQQYLTGAQNQAQQALAGGTAQGVAAYAPLTQLGQKYGAATTLYQDLLGVNGPERQAAARTSFTASPSYQFNVDEQMRALQQSAAAKGGLLGGNTLTALQDRASGLAGQEYNNYLAQLGGFVSPELQATTSAAQGIGAIYPAQSAREAQLLSDIGQQQAGLASGLGTSQAALLGGVTGAQAGILGNVAGGQVNVLGNVAGGQAAANQQAAQAAMQGSQAFWNGLFNLGSAAAKAFAA